MSIEAKIETAVNRLSEAECRELLRAITYTIAADCGRAPKGMAAEGEDYQRHSCVDAVEEICGQLSDRKLPIE